MNEIIIKWHRCNSINIWRRSIPGEYPTSAKHFRSSRRNIPDDDVDDTGTRHEKIKYRDATAGTNSDADNFGGNHGTLTSVAISLVDRPLSFASFSARSIVY